MNSEYFKDHLKEFFEGDLSVSVEVDLAQDHLPFVIIDSPRGRRLILSVLGDQQAVILVIIGTMIFVDSPASKHLFDFINSDVTGLIGVKHVKNLAQAVLIDYLGRVQVSDEELRVVDGAIIVEVQLFEYMLGLLLCLKHISVEVLLVSFVNLMIL